MQTGKIKHLITTTTNWH